MSGRGRPSVPGEVVAVVMVLQALESLSDREACQRWRTDIAWKAAAGLASTDEGFHHSVLTLWRNRLRASGGPEQVVDAVREVIATSDMLAGRARRVLDSVLHDDPVARHDTVTLMRAQLARAHKLVPTLGDLRARESNLDPAEAVMEQPQSTSYASSTSDSSTTGTTGHSTDSQNSQQHPKAPHTTPTPPAQPD